MWDRERERESVCGVLWCSQLLCAVVVSFSRTGSRCAVTCPIPPRTSLSLRVTRCDPLRARRLSCVSRIRDPERVLSPCAPREAAIAPQTCVTCLRADRWVCSKRDRAHFGVNSSQPESEEFTIKLETVLDIITPRSFCYLISHVKRSGTRVSHPPAPVVPSSWVQHPLS